MLCTAQVGELEGKANQAMILKFGRVVDLDRLEGLAVNHIVEQLRDKLKEFDCHAARETNTVEVRVANGATFKHLMLMHNNYFCLFVCDVQKEKIQDERQRLKHGFQGNTQQLGKVFYLQGIKKQMEEKLNSRQQSLVS